jgi:hypothetical protein
MLGLIQATFKDGGPVFGELSHSKDDNLPNLPGGLIAPV